MIASEELERLAEKLKENPESITASDVYVLHLITNTLAKELGYEGSHDIDLILDALKEMNN